MSEAGSAGADARDPSMAEILASIQRILSENESDDRTTKPAAVAAPRAVVTPGPEPVPVHEPLAPAVHAAQEDVLVLEKSMMVAADGAGPGEPPYKSPLLEAATSRDMAPMPPQPVSHTMPHPFPLHEAPESVAVAEPVAPPAPPVAYEPPPVPLRPAPIAATHYSDNGSGLVAADTAAVAASAIGNLVRTIAAERVVPVQRGGLTIEDLVREELRPLLKSWLDAHLPPLVEKLVQVEIERVVNRASP